MMAQRERIERALRAADAVAQDPNRSPEERESATNDARQLAQALRAQGQQQPEAAPEQSQGFFSSVNDALQPIHDASQRMLGGVARNIPMGDTAREYLQDQRILPDSPPEGLLESALDGAGDALFWTGAGTAALAGRSAALGGQGLQQLRNMRSVTQAAPAAAQANAITTQGAGTADRAGQAVLQSMQARPGVTAATETLAGAGAGAGAEVGRQMNDSAGREGHGANVTEAGGGLLGGMLAAMPAGMTPAPTAARAGRNLFAKFQDHVLPFTDAGARPRAAAQTQGRAQDPEGAALRMDDVPEGVTPARASEDPGLMAQERRVLDDNPALRRQVEADLSDAQTRTTEQTRNLFGRTRSQGEWEREVMNRVAAPGAQGDVMPGDPDVMLTQAFDSYQSAYSEVRGLPIQNDNLNAGIQSAVNDSSLMAGDDNRRMVANWMESQLGNIQGNRGADGLRSDDLLDLRHAVRAQIRSVSQNPNADGEQRRNLLQNVEREITNTLEDQLPTGMADRLRAVDGQYRQYKVVEDAVYRSGERGLNPERMSEAIRQSAQSRGQFARGGDGELRSLALTGWPMEQLLRDPELAARSVRGLSDAEKAPLKANVVENLMRQARDADPDGNSIVSGAKLRALTQENSEAARALGMNSTDISRLNHMASQLTMIQRQSPGAVDFLYEDAPNVLMQVGAQLLGAKAGQRIAGRGIGSSLVLAQFMSKRARDKLAEFTSGEAERLMVDATTDPKLYQALLTGPTSSQSQRREAGRSLNAWLLGETEDLARDTADTMVEQSDGAMTPRFNPPTAPQPAPPPQQAQQPAPQGLLSP